MKKIMVFGASTSRNSINKRLAYFAAGLLENVSLELLDLNDFDMPIYSIDKEHENGIPEPALRFKEIVKQSDGIIISFAEHNGSYSAAFKNIFDWISRIEKSTWEAKPMLLMAASPGGRGGRGVLDAATARMPFNDGKVVATFSLPFFGKNFEDGRGVTAPDLLDNLRTALNQFETVVHSAVEVD
ncbi:MAG: NAD(P)H-dependent oxidoreductase [Saprospiraceae bacterium]|nr:NAD(P)H-dependent oxidoreductase [Saprospiraceae bacterium]